MATLDRNGLFTVLDRFSRVESLLAPDRVCLAHSQATRPELRSGEGFIFHWAASALPWFLRPLELVISSGNYLVELTQPRNVAAFAQAADECFTVLYYSFSRAQLPSVLSTLKSGLNEAIGVAHQDPTYAELEFCCDSNGHDRVLVLTRGNRECPADLLRCFDEIEDLDEA